MTTDMPMTGYPAQYFSMQPNLPPLATKRQLAAEELALMAKGTKQWTGKWFPHLGTELWELMSDPKKQASIWGHTWGAIGGVVGGTLATLGHFAQPEFISQHPGPTAALVALGSLIGLPAAWLAKESAEQKNGNKIDMWPRLPFRPTLRDYLSDPVANQFAPMQAVNASDIAPKLLSGAAYGLTIAGMAAANRNMMRPSGSIFNRPTQTV